MSRPNIGKPNQWKRRINRTKMNTKDACDCKRIGISQDPQLKLPAIQLDSVSAPPRKSATDNRPGEPYKALCPIGRRFGQSGADEKRPLRLRRSTGRMPNCPECQAQPKPRRKVKPCGIGKGGRDSASPNSGIDREAVISSERRWKAADVHGES